MENPITKLFQVSKNDCVACCIAMMMGMTQEEYENSEMLRLFRKEYHENPQFDVIAKVLNSDGWYVDPGIPFSPNELLTERAQILIVPSLGDNVKGMLHAILVDMTDGKCVLHDPSEGFGGSYYVFQNYEGEDPRAFKIKTWVLGLTAYKI